MLLKKIFNILINNIIRLWVRYIQNIYNIVENLKGVWDGTSAQKFADKIESHKSEYEAFGKLINQVGEFLHDIDGQQGYDTVRDRLLQGSRT